MELRQRVLQSSGTSSSSSVTAGRRQQQQSQQALLGGLPEDVVVEGFAVVREAAHRVLGMRHYDVQLVGQ